MSDILLERVALPQGRRLRGGLLDSAETLPEGWERGIRFRTIGCVPPEVLGVCEVGDPEDVRPSAAEFRPAWLRTNAVCALMSQVGTVNLALNRLEAVTEWGLARMLATGGGTEVGSNPPNVNLLDATSVHASSGATEADVVNTVSCLEQAVADTGYGAAAVLHAPFRAAAWLRSNHLMDWFDGAWYSPSGLRWIISPGYPQGEDFVTTTIWATGPVWAAVDESYVLAQANAQGRTVDWQTNLDAAYSQRLGLAAFDPCLNLAASFVAPACNGDS